MEVLIVEDDAVIGKALRQGLTEAGHTCTWVRDGDRGLEASMTQQFEAIVLDVMLPEKNGVDVLHAIRTKGLRTPVILLTALGSVEERVAGLNAGADDYLVKPFAFSELIARLEAVRRRTLARPAMVLEAAGLTLDLATRRVHGHGKDIDLTPTEFSILELLMRYAGQVVTRKMLCEHLWEADFDGTTNVIEVHMNRLRNKLLKRFQLTLIETVRGRGYALRASP